MKKYRRKNEENKQVNRKYFYQRRNTYDEETLQLKFYVGVIHSQIIIMYIIPIIISEKLFQISQSGICHPH